MLHVPILAVTNVGIGLAIFSRGLSRFQDLTILYVYLGYIGFFLIMIGILFVIFTVIAYTSSDESELLGGGSLRWWEERGGVYYRY